MYRILKIGMDVHSKTYTLCAMEPIIQSMFLQQMMIL